MSRLLALFLALVAATTADAASPDRQWQTGTWAAPTATIKADSAHQNLAIETDHFRLDLQLNLERGGRLANALADMPVTFAIDGEVVYIKQARGERALRLVKKTEQLKTYAATGGGHYIRAVGDDGLKVTLEDGSVWEIDPMLQFRTRLWQPYSDIAITRRADSLPSIYMLNGTSSDFDYFLNNVEEDEGAAARLLSR